MKSPKRTQPRSRRSEDQTVIRVPDTLPTIELPGGRTVSIGKTHPPQQDAYVLRFRRGIGINGADFQETQVHLSAEAMQALNTLTGWYGFKAPEVLAIELEIDPMIALIKNGAHTPLHQKVLKEVMKQPPVGSPNPAAMAHTAAQVNKDIPNAVPAPVTKVFSRRTADTPTKRYVRRQHVKKARKGKRK